MFERLDGMIEKAREEARREGHGDGPIPIPVMIYPSGEDEGVKHNYEIAWFASYIGQERADAHGRPKHKIYRPESTERHIGDNVGHWTTYWYVTGLYELRRY